MDHFNKRIWVNGNNLKMLYYDYDEGRTRRYISGGGQCTENGTRWWNQRIKKATKAVKDAFMKWQLS